MGKLYVYGVKGYMEVLYFLYKPKTALKIKSVKKQWQCHMLKSLQKNRTSHTVVGNLK